MNKAISWITDEHFTDGKEYECSCTYNNMIEVLDNNGKLIKVGLDDLDFTFMLNVRTCDGCSHYGDFYKPQGDKNNYFDKSEKFIDKNCLTCGVGNRESTYCNGCVDFSKWLVGDE